MLDWYITKTLLYKTLHTSLNHDGSSHQRILLHPTRTGLQHVLRADIENGLPVYHQKIYKLC